MEQFIKFIEKNTKGKRVLALFFLTNIIYALMLLITIPKLMIFSNGLKTMDMMPLGYDVEHVLLLFKTLGEAGRDYYLWRQLPIDMIYPALFAIGYLLLMAYLLKRLHLLKPPFVWLCCLPVFAGAFDYFENFLIVGMLLQYPNIQTWTVQISSIITIIKSLFTSLFFIGLIGVILMLIFKFVRKNYAARF